MSVPMVHFEHVSKRYSDTWAVRDLELVVQPGEFFCFLGPNGAGKTTSIRMMTGLSHPTEGRVLINGIDIEDEPRRAKQLMGYVPDKPFLFEKLTAREFMAFTCGLYGYTEQEIADDREYFLKLFELDEWGDELLESFSHGMRQKILMSTAFLHKPRLLVVDEPMVGLDPRGTVLIKRLLKEMSRKGTTIFMSTHSLNVAQELADRIGIIFKGRMIALGTMEELTALASRSHTNLEGLFLELTGGDDVETLIHNLRV